MESVPGAGSWGRSESCSREATLALSHCAAFCSFWFSVFPSLPFRKAFKGQLAVMKG